MHRIIRISILCILLGLVLEGGCIMATFGKIGAKSMLEHRKFARNYVQDGLLALWDAEENVGWNKHEANPQIWKNLVGNGLDMISNGDPVFYNQYIQPTSLQQLWHTDVTNLFDECISSGTFTAEVFYWVESPTGNSNKMLVFGGSEYNGGFNVAPYFYDDGSAQGPRTGIRMALGTTYATPFSRDWFYGTASGTSISGRITATLIHNNQYIQSSNTNSNVPPIPYTSKRFTIGYRYNYTSSSPMTNGKERVYSIRIYNRALSFDELNANAAIDKARFHFT